jgi:hypothetical protein
MRNNPDFKQQQLNRALLLEMPDGEKYNSLVHVPELPAANIKAPSLPNHLCSAA